MTLRARHLAAPATALAVLACLASSRGPCRSTESPPTAAAAPSPPVRIVSLAPSITEVLFALGAGDRVVGVTEYCDFPEAARSKKKVGGYDAPNVELVLEARPDLALCASEGAALGPVDRLRGLGVRVEPIAVTRLADLAPSIEKIARLVGREAEGAALARSLERRIAVVRRAVAARPRVRALLALDHRPLIVAGRGSFGDDLLESAGIENLAGRSLARYPQLDAEAVLAGAPELVIDASMSQGTGPERPEAIRAAWRDYDTVPAVRDGRVVAIDPDIVVRPGPRLVDGLEALARVAHPGAFP